MQNNSKEKIVKEMVAVGNWLAGTLEIFKEDNNDNELLYHLNQWLSMRTQRIDPLMIGTIRCNKCEASWDILTYKQNIKNQTCPQCGELLN